MNLFQRSRLMHVSGLMLCALVWLANNGNPPNGRTGAPFDGSCNDCHSGGSFNGDVEVTGLPATIDPNTTYPLVLTMTPTAGSPIKGGFQLVVVNANNGNCGDLTASNAQSGTEFAGGREYIDHRTGKAFPSGGPISWNFTWKSPGTVPGNTVKFYFIGNFTNNSNNSDGDNAIASSLTIPFAGPPPVNAGITSTTNVLCFGGNTGSATVEAADGVPPYTYLWSNGQTAPTAINLTAGTYTVTVTGSSGSGTATAVAVITQPSSALTVSLTASNNINCISTSATLTANAVGGTPGYTFAWSTSETSNTIVVEDPGTYLVTVTDANGCTKTGSVSVTSSINPPTAVAGPAGAEITCNQPSIQLSGAGSSTGANFTYLWTASGGGSIVSGANTLTPTVNACGTYTLKVTNTVNACTATASVSVACNTTPPNATATGGTLTCTATSIVLNGNSTTTGVTYAWSGPGGFTSNIKNPTVSTAGVYTLTVTDTGNGCTKTATATVNANTVPPGASASGGTLTCTVTSVVLNGSSSTSGVTWAWSGPGGFASTQQNPTATTAGVYTLTVTDSQNGCTKTATATVALDNTPPSLSLTGGNTLTCTNTSTQICVNPTGLPAYIWTNGATTNCITTTTPGTYTVTATGSNGCTAVAAATVVQNITPPLVSIASPPNLNCNNATVQINATASSQGASFTYLWTTSNGNIQSGATTLTPTVSSAGNYNLLITNADNGCTATGAIQVNQSAAIVLTTASVNVLCNGGANGSVQATASGGGGGYTYLWNTSATTANISNLTAGTYTLTATDSENCTKTTTVNITQPPVLNANASATGQTAVGVNDGTATAAPTGGTPAYAYAWSNGGTTATITGLAPGNYTVSVTDANGCTAVQTVTVNSYNCNVSVTTSSTNVACNGGATGGASATLTGGTNPVLYIWSNGSTMQNITGVVAGVYTATATDANGCSAVATANITEPPVLNANVTATGVTAAGATDGTASASPTGGTAGYSYLWSTGATTAQISGLAPGTYTTTVTDANGCTAVQSGTVNAFNCTLTASISSAGNPCFGAAQGVATATPGSGTGPFTYLWSNNASTQTITGLTAGVYTVSITDAASCVATATTTIGQPPVLTAVATVTNNVVCKEDNNGSVVIQTTGGTAPYTFGIPGGNPNGLTAGNYTATVTDANNCTTTASFTIAVTDNVPPTITCPANISICGVDLVNYSLPTVTDNCALGAQPLSQTGGLPNGAAFPEGATVQTYKATDVAGNTASCSFTVTVFPVPDVLIVSTTNDQNSAGVGAVNVTPSGGVGPYAFNWKKDGTPFATTEDLTGLFAGIYQLVMTDANGCTVALAPIKIDNLVGVADLDAPRIRVYPNPANAFLFVQTDGMDPVDARCFDMKGREASVFDLSSRPFPVDHLPGGVYWLKLVDEKGRVFVVKWVKGD